MKKVAILGIENSHAWSFAGSLAGFDGKKTYDDIELVGFYADLNAEDGKIGAAELKKVTPVNYFAECPCEFADKVDGVMVTARHGKNHLPFARPYLEKGLPVWVDKPLTASVEDALELVKLAKEHNAPVTGGSSLVFAKEIVEMASFVKEHRSEITGAHVTAPIDLVNNYGNFWFYSAHLVQMIIAVFGPEIRTVNAKYFENHVEASYKYDDLTVTAYFGTGYTVTVYKGGYEAKCSNVTLGGCYDAELHEFYQMIKTGEGVQDYREFIAPVFVIDATIKSFQENRTVEVNIPNV